MISPPTRSSIASPQNSQCPKNGRILELSSRQGLHSVRPFVQHSGSTLAGLSLTRCSFSFHDLGVLLDLLARGSSETEEPDCSRLGHESPAAKHVVGETQKLTIAFAHLRSNDGAGIPTWTSGGEDSLGKFE